MLSFFVNFVVNPRLSSYFQGVDLSNGVAPDTHQDQGSITGSKSLFD